MVWNKFGIALYVWYWILLYVLSCSSVRSSKNHIIDPVLLQDEAYTKLTLFIPDSFISSKLFFLEVR